MCDNAISDMLSKWGHLTMQMNLVILELLSAKTMQYKRLSEQGLSALSGGQINKLKNKGPSVQQ